MPDAGLSWGEACGALSSLRSPVPWYLPPSGRVEPETF